MSLFVLNEDIEYLVTSFFAKSSHVIIQSSLRFSFISFAKFYIMNKPFSCYLSLKQDTKSISSLVFALNPFHPLSTLLWVFENASSWTSCTALIDKANLVSLLKSWGRAWHQILSSGNRCPGSSSLLTTVMLPHTNTRPMHIRHHSVTGEKWGHYSEFS